MRKTEDLRKTEEFQMTSTNNLNQALIEARSFLLFDWIIMTMQGNIGLAIVEEVTNTVDTKK